MIILFDPTKIFQPFIDVTNAMIQTLSQVFNAYPGLCIITIIGIIGGFLNWCYHTK